MKDCGWQIFTTDPETQSSPLHLSHYSLYNTCSFLIMFISLLLYLVIVSFFFFSDLHTFANLSFLSVWIFDRQFYYFIFSYLTLLCFQFPFLCDVVSFSSKKTSLLILCFSSSFTCCFKSARFYKPYRLLCSVTPGSSPCLYKTQCCFGQFKVQRGAELLQLCCHEKNSSFL